MPFFGLNPWMLLGLAGIGIPLIIHLLNRRRFEVVDWGAMQFLQISETTRRRLLIEEVLLMLLRMGLIAIMVLALAAPYIISPWLSRFMAATGGRPNRDVVLVFDGSYSMGFNGGEQTPHERAKEWALAYLKELGPGDNVSILQAKQQVVKVLGEPTADLEKAREAVRKLPGPRGGVNWPQTMQAALEILRPSRRPLREIIILSDGQRLGWCDGPSDKGVRDLGERPNTLLRWELMTQSLPDERTRPNVWVVNVAPERKDNDPPNWTLMPLRSSRAVVSVGQRVRFRTSFQFSGQKDKNIRPPYRLRLEIDGGRDKEKLDFPATAQLEAGQLPFEFHRAFRTPGSHLVSVIVEPDPAKSERDAAYPVKDELPGDNRQDIAIEVVPALPVLLVDGDTRANPKRRGTDFIQAALAPAADPTPSVLARVVPVQAFTAAQLQNDLDKERPGSRPRVLVLSNVARLTGEQQEGIVGFLNEGGSVLVTLGERVDASFYNEQLYRNGSGWLPARLEEKAGNESEEEKAVAVMRNSFFHAALEPFQKTQDLATARFPRRWSVAKPPRNSPAAAIALLTDEQPFLVERAFGQGRVILSVVPLDNSWRTNLIEMHAFIPLVHELIYYLAGARGIDFNLRPGQPLRYRPGREETPAVFRVQPPEGEAKTIPATTWPPVFDETRETGVYTLHTADDRTIYYVAQPDLVESDLTLSKPEEREQVAVKLGSKVNLQYEDDRDKVIGGDAAPPKLELWWIFLIGVTLLLCGEVWMTRRIALNR